jgi:hypothetical protein
MGKMRATLCKGFKNIKIFHKIFRLRLQLLLVRTLRKLKGLSWDKYWLESKDTKFSVEWKNEKF